MPQAKEIRLIRAVKNEERLWDVSYADLPHGIVLGNIFIPYTNIIYIENYEEPKPAPIKVDEPKTVQKGKYGKKR